MPRPLSEALRRARRVRLMVFDVDGVLTDGRLWYGPGGEALKAFHVRDGHGLRMLSASGVGTAILSGRRSDAVAARAAELGIADVFQGVEDKRDALDALLRRRRVPPGAAGYMGDDLPDLPALGRSGFACAPRDAPPLVRRQAHYVAAAPAGGGAVREVCELLMRAQGTLEPALAAYLA